MQVIKKKHQYLYFLNDLIKKKKKSLKNSQKIKQKIKRNKQKLKLNLICITFDVKEIKKKRKKQERKREAWLDMVIKVTKLNQTITSGSNEHEQAFYRGQQIKHLGNFLQHR